MAIVVESTSSANTTSSTTLTITKPTGVVGGDFLIAVLSGQSGTTVSTLSGWTAVGTAASTQNAANIQFKVATAADVSASDYTFTFGDNRINTGSLMRVSGIAGVGYLDTFLSGFDNSDSGTLITFSDTDTAAVDGSLFVMALAAEGSDSGVTPTMSGYYVTGDTLTWTELYDSGLSTVGEPSNAGAYAIQSTAAEVTAFGATRSRNLDHIAGILAIFSPAVNASDSNTLVTTDSTTFTQSGTADAQSENTLTEATAEAFTQNGTGTTPPQWAAETKPSTNWTKEI